MNDKLVSIVMPAYNSGSTISEAIQSVLIQTYSNWELLICNDNSYDDTVLKVQSYNDSRIKLFNNEYSKGAAGARNTSLKHANGRYVAFLDSDDIWVANKLEEQLKFMQTHKCAFVYGNYRTIKNGLEVGKFIAPKTVSYIELLKKCDIGCLTVILDRIYLHDFCFPLYPKEDYYLWLNILKENKIIANNCNEVCAIYRLSDSSISSNKTREIKRQWQVLSHFVNNPLFRAYLIIHYILNGIKKHIIHYKKGNK